MTGKTSKRDCVVITAKRLDAGDREQTEVEVDAPHGDAAQQAQLIELVHSRYPEAEFRSFADEAASFLAHKLLVVAVYRRSDEAWRSAAAENDAQEQLFAA